MARRNKKKRQEEQTENHVELDAFEAGGSKVTPWFEKNLLWIGAAVLAVLLLIVGVDYLSAHSTSEAGLATSKLKTAVDAYSSALQSTFTSTVVSEEDYKDARRELAAARESGLAGAQALALLYEASVAQRVGKHQESAKLYEEYLKTSTQDDPFRFVAIEGRGYAYESMGNLDDALHAFRQLTREDKYSDYGHMHLARVANALGQKDIAKASYTAVVNQSPESPLKSKAQERLDSFK